MHAAALAGIVASLLLASSAGFAQPEDAVRVNATRFPEEARKLPASVSVITAEDIAQSAARTLPEVWAAVGLAGVLPEGPLTPQTAETVAGAVRHQTGATHALAVLIDLDERVMHVANGPPCTNDYVPFAVESAD